MWKYHQNMVKARTLRTQREALKILGFSPNSDQLDWAKKSYDIISIENSGLEENNLCVKLTKTALFRKMVSMKITAKIRSKLRTFYRKILGKPDFKLEEN